MKRRSEQGFTVIQAVVLAEFDGLHMPNANADTPLINDDPEKPMKNISPTGTHRFTPPSTGYGYGWVLVLDDAAKHFAGL